MMSSAVPIGALLGFSFRSRALGEESGAKTQPFNQCVEKITSDKRGAEIERSLIARSDHKDNE